MRVENLKYRAWHKELHDMTFSQKEGSQFWFKVIEYPENYELMQFTGLKDKNGIDIYEGDILEWTSWKPEHYPYKNIVEFFAGGTMCGFRLRNKSYTKSLTGNGVINSKALILGNIYENKGISP